MKLQHLFLGGLSLLALTACSSLDDDSEYGYDSNTVKFTSYIEGLQRPAQRVVGSTWNNGDAIGVFMKKSGATVTEALASNQKYTTDDKGNLTAADAQSAITFPEDGSAVDFVAYYPYTASVAGGVVNLDVTNQASQSAIDFLYSDNAKNVTSGNVILGFSHKLAKVVLNVSADATIATTAGLQVSLKGLQATGTYNLDNATLTATGSAQDIAMNVAADGKTAEAILLPATDLSAAKLVFTLGGQSVEKALPVSKLEGGSRYAITVKLGNTGGQTYVQFGQATITDWVDVPGGDVNVDFNGGGTVDPTPDPDPQPGTEVTIFEETFGDNVEKKDGGSYWPGINETSYWTSSSGLTFTDAIQEANGLSYSNISVRKTSSLDPHAWFAAKKDGEMTISGFNTTGYTNLKLTYSITANANGDQNVIGVKFGDKAVTVPSKAIATQNEYQVVEITGLEAGATSLTFTMDKSTNTAGYRIDNIKLVGTK